jgi:pyrroline-5-carboxylate reductase
VSIKLGVIGGGVMAEAIVSRLIAQGVFSADAILVSEPLPQRCDFLKEKYQVKVTTNNTSVARATDVLLLAVKPQIFDQVAAPLQNIVKGELLIVSILAGVSLKRLQAAFPSVSVVRAMPNTPATVGAGVTAIAPSEQVTPSQLEQAKSIFAAIGEVVEVPEYLLDAVTGLSGSGPAYIAIMVEALADGGVAAGLPRAIAAQLALDTVLGTAKLIKESQIHPAELKDRVASPGGTTIAGICALEKAGFRSALIEAVRAATKRSQELG